MFLRKILVCFFLALCLPTLFIEAQEPSQLYQEKARLLVNFAQFTDWPADAFATNSDPIVIGFLGKDPFHGFLQSIVRNETVASRPLVVERYNAVEEIKRCHILYIGQSEARDLERIVKKLDRKPVLTVSDVEDAAFRGAGVGFAIEQNRIKLRINLARIKASRLTVSSKLLDLAKIVKSSA
jgi:hypothetical protein